MANMRRHIVLTLAALLLAVFSWDAQSGWAEEATVNNNASVGTIQAMKKRNILRRKRRMESQKQTTETATSKSTAPAASTTGTAVSAETTTTTM